MTPRHGVECASEMENMNKKSGDRGMEKLQIARYREHSIYFALYFGL